jgi:AcrR family transcriptional regulator
MAEVQAVSTECDKEGLRERLLQTMRDYLAQAESPQISVEDFCTRAGITPTEFHAEFPDIYSLQLLLVSELVAFDLQIRDELTQLSSLMDKALQYSRQFWGRYPKADFDQYELNLLQAGLIDYFQQTPEAAAITRSFRHQHWCLWLQQAIERESLITDISVEGLADLQASFQTTLAIATAFTGKSNRDASFLVGDLQRRYFQRKTHSLSA